MSDAVLVVDEPGPAQKALIHALKMRGVPFMHVPDTFQAMGVLGRAEFASVVCREGKRHLALRGLFNLARKRHPGIPFLVVMNPESTPETARKALGDGVQLIAHSVQPDALALQIAHAQPVNDQTMRMAPLVSGDRTVVTAAPQHEATALTPAPNRPELTDDPTDEMALLEGSFDEGPGAAVLVALFAQELTGRLSLNTDGFKEAIFFHRGEPVWAWNAEGDQGLLKKLVAGNHIPRGLIVNAPEGELLATLVQDNHLTGQAMEAFTRSLVRDAVLKLASKRQGTYRFVEDRSFLESVPLVKVNPVGLILEARRRTTPPNELMTLSADLVDCYLGPGPSLQLAAAKIRSFIRGHDASALVTGQTTVREFLQSTGLDELMGTMLVLAFSDAKLLRVSKNPMVSDSQLRARPLEPQGEESTQIVDTDDVQAPINDEEEQAREEFFAWYQRLKPLTRPTQVLGVELDADVGAITQAYQERLRVLDPKRIPEGSARHLMVSRVEELRKKVASAYEALIAQHTSGSTKSSNPF